MGRNRSLHRQVDARAITKDGALPRGSPLKGNGQVFPKVAIVFAALFLSLLIAVLFSNSIVCPNRASGAHKVVLGFVIGFPIGIGLLVLVLVATILTQQYLRTPLMIRQIRKILEFGAVCGVFFGALLGVTASAFQGEYSHCLKL
ncbi:MAG: hypothetical protein ACR2JX_07865 [Mycobacteriales bacterium]